MTTTVALKKSLRVRLGDTRIEIERRIKALQESLDAEQDSLRRVTALINTLTPEREADIQRVLDIYGIDLDRHESIF